MIRRYEPSVWQAQADAVRPSSNLTQTPRGAGATGTSPSPGRSVDSPRRAVHDEIDAVAANPYPWATDDRAAVLDAIASAARETDYYVHISDVRYYMRRQVDPHMVGAVICALVRQGVLVGTGEYWPSGNAKSRNRTRPAEVRRLVKSLPN